MGNDKGKTESDEKESKEAYEQLEKDTKARLRYKRMVFKPPTGATYQK